MEDPYLCACLYACMYLSLSEGQFYIMMPPPGGQDNSSSSGVGAGHQIISSQIISLSRGGPAERVGGQVILTRGGSVGDGGGNGALKHDRASLVARDEHRRTSHKEGKW